MKHIGFDNDKYLKLQSQHIKERIESTGGKLYLEFGGKIFDDYHAMRVLPGFEADSKLQMLAQLKDDAEVIMVVNAGDIEKNKKRGDLGITYDMDAMRLIDAYRSYGLNVSAVVLTRFAGQDKAVAYQKRLESLGLKVYRHYPIAGYPSNVPLILSDEGYGSNEYIETEKSLVVVTAPGPGSGKMAVCLSQLYQEHQRGVDAGYAKFETFPIWNLPLKHPVNLAYEAATADLADVNMIDPFHLEAYGETAVNYNRDVEIFPVLNSIYKRIYGESPYKSPTDMGVNMAGYCIFDDEAVSEASKQEIVRRYYTAMADVRRGNGNEEVADKIELLMDQCDISADIRPVVAAANAVSERTDGPAAALELNDGTIITGRTTALLGATSACVLNSLKKLAGIPDEIDLLSAEVIEPIQQLKVEHFGDHNPRMHVDEILVALTICARTDENGKRALEKLDDLKDCEFHSSVILSSVDERILKQLGINYTCEPAYEKRKLYHR